MPILNFHLVQGQHTAAKVETLLLKASALFAEVLAALSRRLDDIAKQIESITAARSQEDNERDSAPDEDWSTEAI